MLPPLNELIDFSYFNVLLSNGIFLYSLKMLRKQRCFYVLKSFRKRPVARYGLNNEILFLQESVK